MDQKMNSGELAMMISGPWAWANLRKSGIDFDLAPIPSVAGNPGRPFVGVLTGADQPLDPERRSGGAVSGEICLRLGRVEDHCSSVPDCYQGLALGALLGIAQIFAFFDLEGGSAIDRAMTSAALGLPFWATINVILLPLVAGQKPQWTAEEMRALFPALIGWLLFCFFLGILSQAVRKIAQYFLGPESPPRVPSHPKKENHVVILGGGFAGVTTAEHLEKQFRDDPTVSFTLISETNSWLFTPMLGASQRFGPNVVLLHPGQPGVG
jgi:hypothetical protein